MLTYIDTLVIQPTVGSRRAKLVGGFNPSEKYARQIGSFKKYLSCHQPACGLINLISPPYRTPPASCSPKAFPSVPPSPGNAAYSGDEVRPGQRLQRIFVCRPFVVGNTQRMV